MFAGNKTISLRQLQCIIMLNVLSFGFFMFPSVFEGFSGIEIILSSAIGGGIMYVIARAVLYVCAENPKGLKAVFDGNLGEKAALLIKILFLVYLLLKGSTLIYMYSSAIKANALLETPFLAVAVIALAIALYAALKGIETLGRAAEIFIFLIFAGILFVFVFASGSGGFSNITPAGGKGVKSILTNCLKGLYFFQGTEIVFVVHMFLGGKNPVRPKDIVRSFELVWIIMTFSAFLIFTKLKVIDGSFAEWPFIKVADIIEIPFAFIERQDFIIIGLISLFMVFGAALSIFSSGALLSDITKKISATGRFSYICLICIAGLTLMKVFPDFYALYAAERILGIFCFALLPLILAICKRFGKGVKENEN